MSIKIVQRPLHLAKWANLNDFDFPGPSRAAKFACIAMFETGTLNLESYALTSVMAISSGNSIYVANGLIQDPLEPDLSNVPGYRGITRILGNLGRPGVVMLVPPQAPLIRAEDPNSWRLVYHHPFNGEVVDSFADTSLHLSFTKYELPISVPIGAVDAEAIMLETLISVYDRNRWVADLDILRNLADEKHFRRLRVPSCIHDISTRSALPMPNGNIIKLMDINHLKKLVSIDNWDELLDPPERLGETQVGVVRACNNWHARLTAMSVSVQKNHRTVVLPTQGLCEDCGVKSLEEYAKFAEILIL